MATEPAVITMTDVNSHSFKNNYIAFQKQINDDITKYKSILSKYLMSAVCLESGCPITPINVYINYLHILLEKELTINNDITINLLIFCIPINKMEKITLSPTNSY